MFGEIASLNVYLILYKHYLLTYFNMSDLLEVAKISMMENLAALTYNESFFDHISLL